MKILQDFLKQVPDHRRPQGQRVPHLYFLEMIVLAGMSGNYGLRPVARFIKNNSSFFEKRYKLLHGVPSGSSVQNFITGLDFTALTQALHNWTKQFLDSSKWMSIDGKALGSTVSDMHDKQQNFKMIVNMFCHEKEILVQAKSFQNKKSNEALSARELIASLEMQGITFVMDALHCQKKQPKLSWSQEMTMFSK